MSHPQLVIFDCDGVLVDSEGVSNAVLARALTAAGVPTTGGESYVRYRGKRMRDITEDVRKADGIALSDDFWSGFERDRDLAFETGLKPIDGAAETVRAVKAAGIAVCVASQGKLEKTERTLGLTGLRPLFEAREIFSAYGVERGKPHPDLFLEAARQMRAPAEACVVVEDTTIGITAALAAEMRAIGLADGDYAEQMRRLGAETITSLRDLPALFLAEA